MYSFSQNFEDVYIYRAFRDVTDGFYVDAGAFDPVVDSVTKMLYDLGWSGINLEPGPSFPRFASRVRDINLPYALGTTEGETVFHYNPADPATSTTVRPNLPADPDSIQSYNVKSETLEAVVRDHAPDKHIHFLKLDIEGAEWDVLQATDWNKVRPELVIAEASLPYSNERRDSGWANHMSGFGYREVFFDGVNTYYLRDESLWRRTAFDFPVNVIDNIRKFDPYQHYNLTEDEGGALIGSISKEVTRVLESESSAVREYLERDLGPHLQEQKDLVAQLKAEQSDYFSRLRQIASDIPECALVDTKPGSRGANSLEAIIEHLAEGIGSLKKERDRLAADAAVARETAKAATIALEGQEKRAEEARAEARLLSKRLSSARASRIKMVELTERVATTLAQKTVAPEPSIAAGGPQAPARTSDEESQSDPLAQRLASARDVPYWRRLIRFRNRALVRRADSFRDVGRWAEAAEAYARSYALRPDRADLCLQMANMLTHLRRFDLAEEAYEEALAKAPGDGLILLHLGHMLEVSGRPTEARKAYSESAIHLPDHPAIANGLGRVLGSQGDGAKG